MKKLIDKIALIYLQDKQILSTRSHGKEKYYFPGGKRDEGETDEETLIREIREELTVEILPETIKYIGTFEAQADSHAAGIIVKMTCFEAKFKGNLMPSNEIEEIRWLTFDDIDLVSEVDKIIFHHLREKGVF